ncbi:MAG: acylphosphatase [Chloroflexi bacterium]|nr:MAG: acylphosphatase [Chloroflexota bacterium]
MANHLGNVTARQRLTARVELVAEGDPVALDALERLRQRGPPGSRVEQVDASRGPASAEFTRFKITRS